LGHKLRGSQFRRKLRRKDGFRRKLRRKDGFRRKLRRKGGFRRKLRRKDGFRRKLRRKDGFRRKLRRNFPGCGGTSRCAAKHDHTYIYNRQTADFTLRGRLHASHAKGGRGLASILPLPVCVAAVRDLFRNNGGRGPVLARILALFPVCVAAVRRHDCLTFGVRPFIAAFPLWPALARTPAKEGKLEQILWCGRPACPGKSRRDARTTMRNRPSYL